MSELDKSSKGIEEWIDDVVHVMRNLQEKIEDTRMTLDWYKTQIESRKASLSVEPKDNEAK